jgi:ubiquinol-cytochrome c reductase cytochrome b subunit
MRVGMGCDSLGEAAALECARMRRVAGRVLLGAAMALVLVGFVASGARATASKTDRAEGAELFKEKGCEHCHGVEGVGTEKGPSLTTVGKRLKKDEIERQIREGGKQMPPFGDVLNEDEMRKLVDYLAHKKKAPKSVGGS